MSTRKNILLISLDDAFSYWKYRSAFGAELQTPNLDRICAQSSAFHSAYCQCAGLRAVALQLYVGAYAASAWNIRQLHQRF
ncbi:hypothetical protein ACERZ8_21380 [Tateyamaria armeniaca]|uniref:Sulfatase N-terminal domain-containing protein n=1 Tax=Tateyamaria armeniaca TaxID=2518930 RepID=A0ABW8V4M6_9RHOB